MVPVQLEKAIIIDIMYILFNKMVIYFTEKLIITCNYEYMCY